jgi:hypothetical protein
MPDCYFIWGLELHNEIEFDSSDSSDYSYIALLVMFGLGNSGVLNG